MNSSTKHLLMLFEGKVLRKGMHIPYLDQALVPTIGYGTTYYPNGKRVKLSDAPINESLALDYMISVFNVYRSSVIKLIKVDISSHKIDAVTLLAYNIGLNALSKSSFLRSLNNNESYQELERTFKLWNKVKNKGVHIVSKGLVSRRNKEWNLFNSSVPANFIIPIILLFYTVFTISL